MPEYKLSYFNMRGRAELARLCFAYGEIPYEDDRIEDTWAERKQEMPGGQVPVLWIDGKPLLESIAITRYVAKQAGLVPEDDLQAAYCDALVDKLADLGAAIYRQYRFAKVEPDEKERILNEEILPNKFNPVVNRLNDRLANQETFIEEMTTWADLQIMLVFEEMKKDVPELLNDYPNVDKHVERMKELAPINNWLSERPATDN